MAPDLFEVKQSVPWFGRLATATVAVVGAILLVVGPGAPRPGLAEPAVQAPSLTVTEYLGGLTIPWGMDFTPDGVLLFTERTGGISASPSPGTSMSLVVPADLGSLSEEIGNMGLTVDPDFVSNRFFYTCQGHVGAETEVYLTSRDKSFVESDHIPGSLAGLSW